MCCRKEVKYQVATGGQPLYPTYPIKGGSCCPQHTECVWAEGIRGECARYMEYTEPYLQRTNRLQTTARRNLRMGIQSHQGQGH